MDYDQDAFQNASGLTVLGTLFLVAMAALTFSLPRRFAVMPLLITTAYMPLGQGIVVAGLHFQIFRVLILLGICRVTSRKESADLVLLPIDRMFIWWGIIGVIFGTLSDFSGDRFVNRVGEAFNAFTVYFLFRCWTRSLEDVMQVVRVLAIMIAPLALSMVVEKYTTRNIFSIFGGVPEITQIREGKLRCQGAFRHPILAGTYAATLFPLCVGLFFQPRMNKAIAILGMVGALVATVMSASSGALLASMAEFMGFGMWLLRCRMRVIRWGIVLIIIGLAMVMKAPVWYLFARVSETMGGTGWHRSYLIDQAIKHFNEWWLIGSNYTVHWAPAGITPVGDPNNMDITNNYIAEGLGGGILKLGLFIAMIVVSFKAVGRWTKEPDAVMFSRRMFVWSMGVCLAGHCVSFMSIAYFDQIVVMWYWLLAAMAMLCMLRLRSWDMMPDDTVSHAGVNVPLEAETN